MIRNLSERKDTFAIYLCPFRLFLWNQFPYFLVYFFLINFESGFSFWSQKFCCSYFLINRCSCEILLSISWREMSRINKRNDSPERFGISFLYRRLISFYSWLFQSDKPNSLLACHYYKYGHFTQEIEISSGAKTIVQDKWRWTRRKSLLLYVINHRTTAFSTGELATSWYILLSGSVFIDGSMFLPRSR